MVKRFAGASSTSDDKELVESDAPGAAGPLNAPPAFSFSGDSRLAETGAPAPGGPSLARTVQTILQQRPAHGPAPPPPRFTQVPRLRAVRVPELMAGMKGVYFEGKVIARYGLYLNQAKREKNKKFCPFNAELLDVSGAYTITATYKLREHSNRFAVKLQAGSWFKFQNFTIIEKDPVYHHGDGLLALELRDSSLAELIDDKPEVFQEFEPDDRILAAAVSELSRLPENYSGHVVASVWNHYSFWIFTTKEAHDSAEVRVLSHQHPIIHAIDQAWATTERAQVFYFRNLKNSGFTGFTFHQATTFSPLGPHNTIPGQAIIPVHLPPPGTQVFATLYVNLVLVHAKALLCATCNAPIVTGLLDEQLCESCF